MGQTSIFRLNEYSTHFPKRGRPQRLAFFFTLHAAVLIFTSGKRNFPLRERTFEALISLTALKNDEGRNVGHISRGA